jgi:hypothetical protein
VITKLRDIDNDLAGSIEMTMDMYSNFRLMDAGIRTCQIEALKLALLASHKRHTENFLESSIREINESIEYIKSHLVKKAKRMFENLKRNHPIVKLAEFFKNPKESAKEICKWAKENPWKAFFISIDIALYVGTNLIFSFYLLGSGYGGVYYTYNYLSTAVMVRKLKANANKEIAKLQTKEDKIRGSNTEKGLRIVDQVNDDERLRNDLKEACSKVFEKNRRDRERKQECKKQREQQFDAMSEEELNEVHPNLSNMVVAMNEGLETARSESMQSQLASREMLSQLTKALEGQEAIRWMMNKISGPVFN